MARKRTPTKQTKGGSRHNQTSPTSKSQDGNYQDNTDAGKAKDENGGALKNESKYTNKKLDSNIKLPSFTAFIMIMSLVTVAVCYSAYPELTSFTTERRKPVPSLRKIIEPDRPAQDSNVAKRDTAGVNGVGTGGVFQSGVMSETSAVFSEGSLLNITDDVEETERIVEEIMKTHYQQHSQLSDVEIGSPTETTGTNDGTLHEQGGQNSSLSEDPETPYDPDLDPGTPAAAHVKPSEQDTANVEGVQGDAEEALTMSSRAVLEPKFSVEAEAIDLSEVSRVEFSNTKKTQAPRSSTDKKRSQIPDRIPPRKGKKKNSKPIILNFENPNVQLGVDDIKIESNSWQLSPNDEKESKENNINKKIENDGRTKHKAAQNNNDEVPKKKTTETSKKIVPSATKEDKNFPDTNTKRKQEKHPANHNKTKKKAERKENSQLDGKSGDPSTNASGTKTADDKFKPSYQRTFSAKKTFYGGRRIAPVELIHQKPSNSSVKIYLFDDFLSGQECDGLMRAHNSHVDAYNEPPILCFDSLRTLRKHIDDAGKNIKVTPNVFTTGTMCVNASFSLQLQTWLASNWSYSTAFYPGESKFSTNIASRMEKAMGLKPENGGKFQITSYPTGKAYNTHTDCTLGAADKRDRVVSVLMYLNDVEDGGETKFPGLGIWVKPKKGRAIVWNNMSPSGHCEADSRHVASLVKQGNKYILIRWYYYKSFPGLGQRPTPPHLPVRGINQALVSCDEYNSGSCRWYDEWTYEHLLDYQSNKVHLS